MAYVEDLLKMHDIPVIISNVSTFDTMDSIRRYDHTSYNTIFCQASSLWCCSRTFNVRILLSSCFVAKALVRELESRHKRRHNTVTRRYFLDGCVRI